MNAIRRTDRAYVFPLARPPTDIRIVSRAAAAQELGASRDARVFGVAVRRIVMREGRRLRMIEAADTALDNGFHLFEPDNAFRWTDGDALVPAAMFPMCTASARWNCTSAAPRAMSPMQRRRDHTRRLVTLGPRGCWAKRTAVAAMGGRRFIVINDIASGISDRWRLPARPAIVLFVLLHRRPHSMQTRTGGPVCPCRRQ